MRLMDLIALILLVGSVAVYAGDGWETSARIRAAASQYAAQQAPEGSDVVVGALDERVRLPLCETALQAQPASGSAARGALSVAVRCDGKDGAGAWTIYVPVRVTQHLQVLVLAKPLASGAVITADALRLQELDTGTLVYGYFTQPEQAVGKVLRKSLAGGNILTPDALEAPYTIKRGQQVTLLSRAGTIEVRADGKALANAADGERVRVESGASRRIVEGIARSGSVVEVNL